MPIFLFSTQLHWVPSRLAIGNMPSSVRVRVVEARDLPEMDRTVRGEFCTDAYVDIKFRNYEQVGVL